LSQDLHQSSEQDVVPRGEKGRGDDQAADLHDEAVEAGERGACRTRMSRSVRVE
jgi:hypothetical protein